MAEDDIYGSKEKYERFRNNYHKLLSFPQKRVYRKGSTIKYICSNPSNLEYFKQLFSHFQAKDISYIRRNRLLQSFRFVVNCITKDLSVCTRDDINDLMSKAHIVYKTPKSKETFVKDTKYIWKILFPEKDSQGRADETIVPYPVRHLSAKTDKSREKLRKDKLTCEEFERIVNYFSNDPRMQAYLTVSLESLARPQELLYVKVGNVELYDNYAKIYITEHGKEGVGLLQCIDSYPYLLKWLDVHPMRKDKEVFLFINIGDTNRCQQLKPKNINKMIRKACKDLNIDKPITCYSLKRNGVTIRRLRGETDMEIQHAARWTSTKQLKIYDLTNQDEAFKRELQKRGLIPAENGNGFEIKKCAYCDRIAGFGEIICQQCKHPLDRNAIQEEKKKKDGEIEKLKDEVTNLTEKMSTIKEQIMQELARDILPLKFQSNHKKVFVSLQKDSED